jgi:Phosphopantothenoylcysteine synthetase/decarboxylase
MEILITAGGTSEKIDQVRQITNKATGRLGCLVAQAFYAQNPAARIDYVCGANAAAPELPNTQIFRVEDVNGLKSRLEPLLKSKSYDAIIHSMAVSDYAVRGAVSAEQLSDELAGDILKSQPAQKPDEKTLSHFIRNSLLKSAEGGQSAGKISSDIENLILVLEKTPKIIGLFRALQPGAVLVGFKLLDGVTEKELLDTAYGLLAKNGCDFVLANDARSFESGGHTGYLLSQDKESVRFEGKQEIARGIVRAVIERIGRAGI